MPTDDEVQRAVDDTIAEAAAEGNPLAPKFQKQRAKDKAKAARRAAKAARKAAKWAARGGGR